MRDGSAVKERQKQNGPASALQRAVGPNTPFFLWKILLNLKSETVRLMAGMDGYPVPLLLVSRNPSY